jgi:2'-5' RNA ligase
MKNRSSLDAGLDPQPSFEGRRSSAEAKADFFEETTSPAFPSEARPQNEILFFALYPPAAQTAFAAAIAETARLRHGFHSKIMARSRMHVTLLPPGRATRLRAPYEVALERAAASVKFEPFDVRFDHVRGFPTGRDRFCFVLGCDDETAGHLRTLHDALRQALHAEAGIAPLRSGPLQPHLTLLYGTHACPPTETIEPVAWRVDRFLLIRSLQGQGKHIVEGEWAA